MGFRHSSLGDKRDPFRESGGYLDVPYCGLLMLEKVERATRKYTDDDSGEEVSWDVPSLSFRVMEGENKDLTFNAQIRAPNVNSEWYDEEKHQSQTMFMAETFLYYFCPIKDPEKRRAWAESAIDADTFDELIDQFIEKMEQCKYKEKTDFRAKR